MDVRRFTQMGQCGSTRSGSHSALRHGNSWCWSYTKVRRGLVQLRQIRNDFARAKGEIGFQTADVSNARQFHSADHLSKGKKPIEFKPARDRHVFVAFFAVLTFELFVWDLGGNAARPSSYPPDADPH